MPKKGWLHYSMDVDQHSKSVGSFENRVGEG